MENPNWINGFLSSDLVKGAYLIADGKAARYRASKSERLGLSSGLFYYS